jgi:hypothetical protein
MSVENKRHTNAHQPFISLSPTEVSIPPLSAIAFRINRLAGKHHACPTISLTPANAAL